MCMATLSKLLSQVYLKRSSGLPGNRLPRFGANCSIDPDRPEWIHYKTVALPPCCAPLHMPGDGQCRLVLGQSDNLVAAGLKTGVKLTVPELDDIISELGVALPDEGSGKNGALLKIDKARALVNHVFKDSSETAESLDAMVQRLCNTAKSVTMEAETDELLLEAVAAIDPEEAKDFKHVIQDCLNRVAAKKKSQGKVAKETVLEDLAAADAAKVDAAAKGEPMNGKWSNHTPEQLRCLLPGKNTLPYVYIRRNPSNDPDKDLGSFTGTYKRKLGLVGATIYRFVFSGVCHFN